MLDYNDAQAAAGGAPLPLVGVLVGNGITNSTVQNGATFAAFAKESGLIAADSPISTEAAARAAMTDALGYEFNYYDYRVKSEDACCGCMGYDYKTWADWHLRADVLAALHVCGDAGDKAFAGCAAGCTTSRCRRKHRDDPQAAARARSSRASTTFYYGKDDTACNFVGVKALAGSLGGRRGRFRRHELRSTRASAPTLMVYLCAGTVEPVPIQQARPLVRPALLMAAGSGAGGSFPAGSGAFVCCTGMMCTVRPSRYCDKRGRGGRPRLRATALAAARRAPFYGRAPYELSISGSLNALRSTAGRGFS